MTDAAFQIETLTLELQQVYASQRLHPGILNAKTNVGQVIGEELIASLNAYVLANDAGPIEEQRIVYDAVKFPKWLPKRLQKRWTTQQTLEFSVQPRWIYPDSTAKLPELGPPYRITLNLGPSVRWDD